MWSIFQNFNNGTQSGNIELSQRQVLLFLHEIDNRTKLLNIWIDVASQHQVTTRTIEACLPKHAALFY